MTLFFLFDLAGGLIWMRNGRYFFTSEAMTEGHPDKVCDQISDTILDKMIAGDKNSRVACETMAGMGFIVVTGEVTTKTYVDIPSTVREVVRKIGYSKPEYGFDCNTVGVLTSIHEQSPDIAMGVDASASKGLGAGDQGMMSGYATNETPELMPAAIMYAQKLAMKLAEVRKKGILSYLRPDGKTQLTAEFDHGVFKRADTVVIAAQHDPDVELDKLREDLRERVIEPVLSDFTDSSTRYFINNTGRFVEGGPVADAGCTGRKIIVDTYGGVGNHGGGAFSGKDPTKVDRTAAYYARYVAKNVVKAGLAERCEVQLAYAIGGEEPVSLFIDTFCSNKVPVEKILSAVKSNFNFKPAEMIEELNLRRPIFARTACYGHFGREEKEFTWEKTDKAAGLAKACGL